MIDTIILGQAKLKIYPPYHGNDYFSFIQGGVGPSLKFSLLKSEKYFFYKCDVCNMNEELWGHDVIKSRCLSAYNNIS